MITRCLSKKLKLYSPSFKWVVTESRYIFYRVKNNIVNIRQLQANQLLFIYNHHCLIDYFLDSRYHFDGDYFHCRCNPHRNSQPHHVLMSHPQPHLALCNLQCCQIYDC